MVDVFKPPFGTYATMVGVVNATAKAELVVILDNFKALWGVQADNPGPGTPTPISASSPDFDFIPESTRVKMIAEIDAIAVEIAASPSV